MTPWTSADPSATASDAVLLVCVYYKVAAADLERAIATVREFQRTLAAVAGATDAQVLLRFAPPRDDASSARSNDNEPPTADAAHADPPSDARAEPDREPTLMETYSLPLPAGDAGDPAPQAAARAFLAALDAAAAPLAGLLRGARHIELFRPCAS